jgi:hypothetical protein
MTLGDTLTPDAGPLRWQPVLLGREAFFQLVGALLQRLDLRTDVPLGTLGLDGVERHLLLALLARNGAVVDETAAWALVTLDDVYERYALAVVDSP